MAKLKFNKVLITGGAGFIGSHLTERLLNEGCRVTVIDDLSEGKWENLPKHVNLVKIKASILGDISKIVAGQDVIFHLAAIPWPQKSIVEPWETHKVNVGGTLNLLLEAKKHKVKKFIFSSSYTVYGDQDHMPINERMEPNPLVPYSLQKLIGEKYCQLFSNLWGLETICLRYFNVFGPRMRTEGPYANLIPKFINLMSRNISPMVNGDGDQTRDFIHVSDVVNANLLAAQSQLSREIFNICQGESISVNKIIEILNQALGKNLKPAYKPGIVETRKILASHAKASKLLGWKPKVKFEDGLKMTVGDL